MRIRFVVSAALLLLAGMRGAGAWDSPAPDVVLYCTPAMEDALHRVAARFTASSHVEVHFFVAPPDGLLGLVRHRARADVVVADSATLQAMATEHLVRPDSLMRLGNDPFVLIGKAGAGLPPGASAADLVAAHSTVVPDPTTAASFDGAALLREALPGVVPAALRGVADTPGVIAAVREDAHLLGLVNRTEAGAPGVAEAASLTVAPATMEGALVTLGQSRNAAALLDFMTGEAGRAVLRAAGLEEKS